VLDYAWPENAKEKRNRVTALGEGTPPDQIYATDSDPQLAAGFTLLREQVTGPYSGVTTAETLFGHASAERLARGAAVQSLSVDVNANTVPSTDYTVGDRARLVIVDEWLDLNLEAVRIIDRTLKGGVGTAQTAQLTLDLNDAKIPPTAKDSVVA
jgi:hypothetical protein